MARDRRIDALRGVAIIAIVAAHAVMAFRGIHFQPQTLLGGTHFVRGWGIETLAVDLAYAVGLPLFGFVTGLTLHHSSRRGLGLVRARASSLLIPYLAWLSLGTGLVTARSGIGAAPGNVLQGLITAGGRGSLWFLYALFVCVCVFAACRTDKALVITALLAPLVMAALAWETVDVLEVRDAAWLYPPLVAGYLVAKHRPRRLVLPALGVLLVTFPLVAQVTPWPLPFAALPVVPGQLLYTLARVACAVAGCIAAHALVVQVRALAWVGQRTLGIYALHPLIIAALLSRGVTSVWLAALAALAGSVAVTLLLEQVPGAPRLLLGMKGGRRRRHREAAEPTLQLEMDARA